LVTTSLEQRKVSSSGFGTAPDPCTDGLQANSFRDVAQLRKARGVATGVGDRHRFAFRAA
jgi:hypothetical protein